MKTSTAILLAGFTAAALFLVAQIAGARSGLVTARELTGERVTRTYDLPPLRHLDLEGPIRLILTAGMPSVTVEGDRAQLAELEDEDEVPDQLTFRIPRSSGLFREGETVTVRVSSPDLREVALSGRGEVQSAAPLDYRSLSLRLSGGTTVDLAFVEIDSLRVSGSGSLAGALRGQGHYLDLDGSGSVDLDASGFRAAVGDLDFSGSSRARVHVDSLLRVDGSGSTTVEYAGDAEVESSMSGSSKVRRVAPVVM